jgi:hypothetical protein
MIARDGLNMMGTALCRGCHAGPSRIAPSIRPGLVRRRLNSQTYMRSVSSLDRLPRATAGLCQSSIVPVRPSIRFNSSTSDPKTVKPETPLPTPTPSSSPSSPSSPAASPAVTEITSPLPSEISKDPAKTDASPDVTSILKLVSLAKPQWRLISVGVGCLVISTGVNLTIPWVIGRIIDFFTPGSEATLLFGMTLPYATATLAAALLVGAAANSGRSICLRLSGQRTAAAIR